MTQSITCPFCFEDGFDLEGLAGHLRVLDWCPVFSRIKYRQDVEATLQRTGATVGEES